MITITGLDKAAVLAALYNASRPQGMGWLHASPDDMTTTQARQLLESGQDFEYIAGCVMKVDLTSDTEFEEWLYDRDNGQGAASRVIDALREEQAPC